MDGLAFLHFFFQISIAVDGGPIIDLTEASYQNA